MNSDQQDTSIPDWEHRYRSGDTPWDRGAASPFLAVCLERLEPGGSLLVPGCGFGHEVVALASLGFQVTGLDLSEAALAACRQALDEAGVQAKLAQTNVLDWQAEGPYDAVYEQTCLCALDPALWDSYALRLADWVRPEGHLCAAFLQAESPGGPPFNCPIPRMQQLFPHPLWDWPEQPPVRIERGPKPFELGAILTRRRMPRAR